MSSPRPPSHRPKPAGTDVEGSCLEMTARAFRRRILRCPMLRILTVTALLLCLALPLRAQQPVELQFDSGLVTLSARNVPVRVILAEWARQGGATIVDGDRVVGPPVTIELTGVPEQQALDILLRNVAGYVLAPSRTGSNSASAFDRIMILASSAAPRNPPPAVVSSPRPVLRRPPIIAPIGADGADDGGNGFDPFGAQDQQGIGANGADGLDPFGAQDQQDEGASRIPGGRGGRLVPRPFVTRPPMSPGAELLDPDNVPDGGPEPAAPAGTAPTPTNPFGIPLGSSQRPGVVTPVPEQQPQ